MVIVFYGNQIYGEYPTMSDITKEGVPEGAYIYDAETRIWWHKYIVAIVRIDDLEEIPAVCKAWALII